MKLMRSLLLTSSVAALVMGTPAMAQQADGTEPPVAVAEPQTATPAADEAAAEAQAEPATEAASETEAGIEDPADGDEPAEALEDSEEVEGEELLETPAVDPIPAIWAPIPFDVEGVSAYGRFLAGRFALSMSETNVAAAELQRAYELAPEQPRLREQAFTAALLAGDLDFAARIAPEDETISPVIFEAGRLVKGVDIYRNRGARRANAYFKENPVGIPHDRAAVYMQVWIAAEAGDWDRALADPPADFDPISALVARGNRARLLEIRRRYDDADAEWQELVSHAVAGTLFRLPYGEFLERRGRTEEALALYDAAIAANQADSRIVAARQRIIDGEKPPKRLTPRKGIEMSLRLAADQMSAQRAYEFAAVYLRLLQTLSKDPGLDLVIGQSLINADIDVPGREALGRVPDTDPLLYARARLLRASSFAEADRSDEALAEFRLALDAVPDDVALNYALANHLVAMKRYEEALELLNSPILNSNPQSYEIRFLRGAAFEGLDRIAEAEAELWAAHQAAPNDPMVSNYLGYLWVDGGTRIEEGAALIARAFAANPDDGNIQDSLGWAQFKQGQYEQALSNLEQAVAKEPANAEINDHLGDVYWAVGRKREAGFQWDRALSLDIDDERREAVVSKLRERLGREPAGSFPVQAAD